ncbi:MAG: alpha/beta fold hydrolase [Sulfitobacter sp.]
MALHHVEVQGCVNRSAEACWAILSAFCLPWHPAIDHMQSEAGGTVRAFTVAGESTLYKERLTWRSDSDRTLRYSHLQGIEGANRYDAQISVEADGEAAAQITWRAQIEADPPRGAEIAAGTEAIFRMGIEALAGLSVPVAEQKSFQGAGPAETQILPTTPPLAVLATPKRDGPLCLFLHGIGGNKGNWAFQLDAAGTALQAAALDLRGYGQSALGEDPSTVEAYCRDILAVREAFGADKLILCGLSYGAWIATSFAMRHPELLSGLVLAGGCTGMSEASAQEREAFLHSREVPLSQGKTPADFAPGVVEVIAGPMADKEVRADLLASMAAIPTATYRDALTCFTHPPEQFDFNRLTMPVLMMTGEYDRLAPPSEIRGVAERIWAAAPDAHLRFEVITGAGHVCNLEQPKAFNDILCAFLGQVIA